MAKLNCFDFDGTLFRTPGREEGAKRYLEAKGEPWPFEGWWGRPESLWQPVLPYPYPANFMIEQVHEAYRHAKEAGERVILMTGRPYKIGDTVTKILHDHGLEFDRVYLRGQIKASDTFGFKKAALFLELEAVEYEEIEIWEDRMEHVSLFIEFGKEIKPWMNIHYVSDE